MLTLAARNIRRHTARTALTLSAIAFGVAALILSGGFVVDLLDQFAESLIHSQSGHLQIARHGYFDDGAGRPKDRLLSDQGPIRALLSAEPHVVETMGRLSFSALLNNGHADLPVIGNGIEPDKERRLGTSLTMIAGRQLADTDEYAILIGEGVASALQLKAGDHATVLASTIDGAMNTLDVEVVGIFRTISKEYDARGVLLSLRDAQALVQTGAVNVVVAYLAQTAQTVPVARRLAASLPPGGYDVKTWSELNDYYEKTAKLYDRQFGILLLIILLMVLFGVANSVNMTAFERLSEFGTMRALGNSGARVFWLIVSENVLLGIVGAAAGVTLGAVLAWAISAIGIPMPPPPNANVGYIARIRMDGGIVAIAAIVGLTAPILAAFWPAIVVSRVPVVEALRAAD
jgi:putative ABC transport system permease protein